jgi:hypothetical protein
VGVLVAEGPHEVLGDSSGGAGGPARGREAACEGRPALLQGQQVLIAGEAAGCVLYLVLYVSACADMCRCVVCLMVLSCVAGLRACLASYSSDMSLTPCCCFLLA